MSRLTSRPINTRTSGEMNVTLKITDDLSGGGLKTHHIFTTYKDKIFNSELYSRQ
jgi:hypothetical protein